MINEKKIVALVPLRGGSKSIPRKNIKPIAGKPLCVWILESLRDVQEIDGVYVSTEDREIAQIVRDFDSDIHVVNRPMELATDNASTESVMLHFANKIDFDFLITAQATSPLTTSEDFRKGLDTLLDGDYDSLLTGVREKRFYWTRDDEEATPVNYDYRKRPRRQDFESWIMENGAFYITSRKILMEEECRLGGQIGILEMSSETAVELDEPHHWSIVESMLMERKKREILHSIPDIRLVVVDVDGTLTDAGMYYSNEGEELKKFNTRDAKGLELIRKQGITISFMTSENSDIVKARAEKLQIENVFIDTKQKMPALRRLCQSLGIDISNVAFIGDDINDLECIRNVGFSACPSDAVREIRKNSEYVCRNKGGKGAVREFCDLLLVKKMK